MPNRLAQSTSPYLLQHKDNPVDWYEWGEEAFDEARRRDVPILLSVGYSACHWCQVMAHESFEDEDTATEMNRWFVNVKVDREERPDVDSVYMEAVQATTGRGGWPMTVFMTPDGHPFFTGTYYPNTDRHGMPAFRRVLGAIEEAWRERRDEVVEQGARVTDAIDQQLPVGDTLPGQPELEAAYRTLESEYDPVNGGFGQAPKFPQQPLLEFLLRIHRRPWAPRARTMLGHTLTRMARGGIYDQVGGGFARYAVDAVWLVPHFEKMLYDNAQLARIYTWAAAEFEVPDFEVIARETLRYMERDLSHPEGGFYSAEDADSEGVEGKFYVWEYDEFMSTAGPDDGPIAADFFGVTPGGNFEGSTILNVAMTGGEVAERHGVDRSEVTAAVRRVADRLFEARSSRVRPGLDNKVIAAWNGLAIRAFAEAGGAFDQPQLIGRAVAAASFVFENMRAADGRLMRSWTDGRATVAGFLDDHAAMAVGLYSLYAVTGEYRWFEAGRELVDLIPEWFADEAGGLYSTPHDADDLIKRPHDQMDNPLPSGTSLAAEAFLLTSLYTGDPEWRRRAEDAVRSSVMLIDRYPRAAGHVMGVLDSMVAGLRELAVVGPDAVELARPAWERFRPETAVAVSTTGSESVPLLADRYRDGRTVAYLCEGFVCDAPVDTTDELRRILNR